MATKVHQKLIPAQFQLLDTTVGDPDRYLSIYARRKIVENFNILLARRSRRNIAGQIFMDPSDLDDEAIDLGQLKELDNGGFPEWRTLIRVNENTRALYISAYFNATDGVEVFLRPFFVPLPFGGGGEFVDNQVNLSTAAATSRKGAREEMELAIEPGTAGWGILGVRMQCALTTPADTGDDIDAWGDYIDIDITNTAHSPIAGLEAITFSNALIPPQPIIHVQNLGGNKRRVFTPDPIGQAPITGTTTSGYARISRVQLCSLTVTEKPRAVQF